MNKIVNKIGFGLLLVFLLIQFYRPPRNLENSSIDTNDLTTIYNVPVNVKTSLSTACYDCHSNTTKYSWYANIQPVSSLLDENIKDGKKELNFNEFGSYSNRKQKSKLDAICKEIKEGEMPLTSYTLIHQDAKLSQQQKNEIIDWITLIANNQYINETLH
ncbi:heme-binding domain-containing protein [Flavobacterium sp. GP15]|uniref:heme-binding domain-containing protein n=1 Tax=Flavobacterium sp. GP15 TaxID=2758567 RepID=UPI00165E684F|nr:heme-binding domain-containing protein [Flavobacterium sp. GP15]